MPSKLAINAIVIKKKELLNLDNLITILTEDFGKINILAKGIKKINSRRAPHIQTANFINIVLYHKYGRYYQLSIKYYRKIRKKKTYIK